MHLESQRRFLYKTNEAPRFVKGHATTLALVGMSAVIYSFMSVYFRKRNNDRKAGKEDGAIRGMSDEEIAELGDENPRFVFTY